MDGLPFFLSEKLQAQYSPEVCDKILMGYSQGRCLSMRINPLKANRDLLFKKLADAGIDCIAVPWYSDALISDSCEADIRKLDEYNDGQLYLQSLSSMIPPLILDPQPGLDILDMAAAPGGKTTQIAALTDNSCRITACEMNSIRAERLEYNIKKQGASCVYVLKTDSRQLDPAFSFDKILLDAPCSGSGTFLIDRKSEGSITGELVERCVRSQKALLSKAFELLKIGGELIYSTCSIFKDENEQIMEWALRNKGIELIPVTDDWINDIPALPTNLKGVLCIAPSRLYEGFFVAKLKKTGTVSLTVDKGRKRKR